MGTAYMLVVMVFTLNGAAVSTIPVPFETAQACEAQGQQLKEKLSSLGVELRTACVKR